MGYLNVLKNALGESVSLENQKLTHDVELGAPQTLITLKDALMSAQEDKELSTTTEEEIVEYEDLLDSMEHLGRVAQIYVRDGGMTPALSNVYTQSFDIIRDKANIDSIGISNVSAESFARDPLTASLEAVAETENAKESIMEKMITKSKLFSVKLGDFLSSYSRISSRISEAVQDTIDSLDGKEEIVIPAKIVASWKSFKETNKQMMEFATRSQMEIDALIGQSKSDGYNRGDYKAVFDKLSRPFLGTTITGGSFSKEEKTGMLRFRAEDVTAGDTVTLSKAEAKKLLDQIKDAATFISNFSSQLKKVEEHIAKSVEQLERQLGSKLTESGYSIIADLTPILRCVRGPGPDYLSFVGNLSRATLSKINSAE